MLSLEVQFRQFRMALFFKIVKIAFSGILISITNRIAISTQDTAISPDIRLSTITRSGRYMNKPQSLITHPFITNQKLFVRQIVSFSRLVAFLRYPSISKAPLLRNVAINPSDFRLVFAIVFKFLPDPDSLRVVVGNER